MSWIVECDQCHTINHSYFIHPPWIVAEQDGSTFQLEVRKSKEASFVVPALPGLGRMFPGISTSRPSNNNTMNTKHFCSTVCVLAYVSGIVALPDETK